MKMTFNEKHELTVLKALVDYNLYCQYKISETEKYPKHCEFWCKEKNKAQEALNIADSYMKEKGD